ncbi:MAG: zinc-binding dehydrogenase [Bradyrhizobium sp.]|nr:zinc-binding dehydrogenase [Bradyrhizobium sp.]
MMKTIGLLGGMSWESTIPYYRLINEGIKARLGGLHSASLLLHSVDFHEIEACQSSGDWQRAGEILAQAAQLVESGKLTPLLDSRRFALEDVGAAYDALKTGGTGKIAIDIAAA